MSAMSEVWRTVIDIVQARGFWAAVSYLERYGYSQDEAIGQVQGALKIKNEPTTDQFSINRQPGDPAAARPQPSPAARSNQEAWRE
jgi:hypothetical protein